MLRAAGLTAKSFVLKSESLTGYGSNRKQMDPYPMPYSPRAKKVILSATDEVETPRSATSRNRALIINLITWRSISTKILRDKQIDPQDLMKKSTVKSEFNLQNAGSKRKARQESSQEGTPTLNSLARLNRISSWRQNRPVVGREDEVRRIIQIIAVVRNKPVLVGEPGVGKTAIVEGLAQRMVSGSSRRNRRKAFDDVRYGCSRCGNKIQWWVRRAHEKILDEVYREQDVILFIDELHTLIGAGGAEGSIDASNILKPALARGEIQVIGDDDWLDEYQKYIEKDAALERRFASVHVEWTLAQTIQSKS